MMSFLWRRSSIALFILSIIARFGVGLFLKNTTMSALYTENGLVLGGARWLARFAERGGLASYEGCYLATALIRHRARCVICLSRCCTPFRSLQQHHGVFAEHLIYNFAIKVCFWRIYASRENPSVSGVLATTLRNNVDLEQVIWQLVRRNLSVKIRPVNRTILSRKPTTQ